MVFLSFSCELGKIINSVFGLRILVFCRIVFIELCFGILFKNLLRYNLVNIVALESEELFKYDGGFVKRVLV